mmetsp:Transcript_378/g.695  ORF Transcript_378/g.695 Transcript_378/m.695 type:complete len:96 (-) Transcript_378:39-326(-)
MRNYWTSRQDFMINGLQITMLITYQILRCHSLRANWLFRKELHKQNIKREMMILPREVGFRVAKWGVVIPADFNLLAIFNFQQHHDEKCFSFKNQ